MLFNNKFLRTLFFPLGCICIGFTSCKKLVEVQSPVNSITVTEVFNSRDQANSVIAGMYSQLMSNSGTLVFSNGGITRFAGLSSDEMANLNATNSIEDYQFFTNTLLATNGTVSEKLWKPPYKIIYSANTVIARLDATADNQVDDSTKRILTSEAKFIRAFCYFYLVNMFGDVPLVLTTDFTQTVTMAKTPKSAVYAQIEEDLKLAQELLLTDYATAATERIRANKWAATALLARVYLYQQKWAEAEAQASAVIGNSQFSILTDLSTVFLKNSKESIFQLQQNATVTPYNATWEGTDFMPTFRYTQQTPASQLSFLSPTTFNSFISFLVAPYYLTNRFVSAFEGGDKRKTIWVDSTATPNASPWNKVPYYFAFKYTTKTGSATGAVTQYYMVLRLAEQYLIRAEARAQLGTDLTGAAGDLNKLRTRAGLTNTTATTKDALLVAVAKERQTELFAEWGHRWFDLKRTGKAEEVLSTIATKQPWSNNNLVYPIPALDVINDPNLVQNDGY
jgi:hypothetical protein